MHQLVSRPFAASSSTFLGAWLVTALCACDGGTVRGPGAQPHESAGETGVETVEVAAPRELRGVWLATVWNINLPAGLTATTGPQALREALETMESTGLNALFFQVRPEGDALYASELEPWSRFLSGTQGVDPGWDPLAVVIEEAHARNIEVHAWLNPYRAAASPITPVAPHLAATHPDVVYSYGSYLWMDPGSEVVRNRTRAVVRDLAARYDIDGIHFDDYFYPYPNGTEFPDASTYQAYQEAGGTLARDDWRRNNVHQLVEGVHEDLQREAPCVRFGISPFGIYRPGEPDGISGMDQTTQIFSDPVVWSREGWVDYLAPQLYWPSTQTAQAYGTLVGWWAALGPEYTFPGNYLSQLGSSSAWTLEELQTQVALTRAQREAGGGGNIWYNIDPLLADTLSVREVFRQLYAEPALPPPVRGASAVPEPPRVEQVGPSLTLAAGTSARSYTAYRWREDAWVLDRVIPAGQNEVVVEPGSWAIAVVDSCGLESRGVIVEVVE